MFKLNSILNNLNEKKINQVVSKNIRAAGSENNSSSSSSGCNSSSSSSSSGAGDCGYTDPWAADGVIVR